MLSQTIQASPQGGSQATPLLAVPPHVSASLNLATGNYWDALRALSKAKAEGLVELIPAYANAAAEALAPCDHGALVDRLTFLGITLLHGKTAEEQGLWLGEMARLLQDYPQEILFAAIDECVTEPGRKFCPTVGEIVAKAAAPLRAAEMEAAHLREMAMLLDEGVAIPDYEPPAPPSWMTAEPEREQWIPEPGETAAILAEVGLRGSAMGETLKRALGAETDAKPKTRADYIAAGKVPPRLDPGEPIYV